MPNRTLERTLIGAGVGYLLGDEEGLILGGLAAYKPNAAARVLQAIVEGAGNPGDAT